MRDFPEGADILAALSTHTRVLERALHSQQRDSEIQSPDVDQAAASAHAVLDLVSQAPDFHGTSGDSACVPVEWLTALARFVLADLAEDVDDLATWDNETVLGLQALRGHLSTGRPGAAGRRAEVDLLADRASSWCWELPSCDERRRLWSQVALDLALEPNPVPDAIPDGDQEQGPWTSAGSDSAIARRQAAIGLLRMVIWLDQHLEDDVHGELTAVDSGPELDLGPDIFVADLTAAADLDPTPDRLLTLIHALAVRLDHRQDPADRAAAVHRLSQLLEFDLSPPWHGRIVIKRAMFLLVDVRDGDVDALETLLDDLENARLQLPADDDDQGLALRLLGEVLLRRSDGAPDPVDAGTILDVAQALYARLAWEREQANSTSDDEDDDEARTVELCARLLIEGLRPAATTPCWTPALTSATDLLARLLDRSTDGPTVNVDVRPQALFVLSDCYLAQARCRLGEDLAPPAWRDAHSDLRRSINCLEHGMELLDGSTDVPAALRRALVRRLFDSLRTHDAWPRQAQMEADGTSPFAAPVDYHAMARSLAAVLSCPEAVDDLRRARRELALLPDWTELEDVAPFVDMIGDLAEGRVHRAAPPGAEGMALVVSTLNQLVFEGTCQDAAQLTATVEELRRLDRGLDARDPRRPWVRLLLGHVLALRSASAPDDIEAQRHVVQILSSVAPFLAFPGLDCFPEHFVREIVDSLATGVLALAGREPSGSVPGLDPALAVVLDGWLSAPSLEPVRRLRWKAAAAALKAASAS